MTVKMGFLDALGFNRLKDGLSKTREVVFDALGKITHLHSTTDDALFEEIEETLIGGDVGVATSTYVVDQVRARVKKDGILNPQKVVSLVKEEVTKLFPVPPSVDPFREEFSEIPHVIMVVGVNGVGKTTTIGKLAYRYRRVGKSVLIAAADTFRAAANEQIEVWTERAGAEILRQVRGADPASVAFDAIRHAQAKRHDIVIVDTAGRLHTKVNLMEELRKVHRVIKKAMPSAPHEVLLVLDATTGQNAIQQARQFTDAVGVTGIALTKLDGTAKGGVVIGIAQTLSIPVRYVGVGEDIGDLLPFDPYAFVEALFITNNNERSAVT